MESTRFLTQANSTSEQIWKYYFKYMKCTCSMMLIVTTLSLFTSWHKNSYDDLYHPAKIMWAIRFSNWFCCVKLNCKQQILYSLPWDQTKPLGYMGEALFFNAAGQAYTISNGVFLILFISMCIYHRVFYDMFSHSIDKWNHRNKNHCPDKILRHLIRFHISIKE